MFDYIKKTMQDYKRKHDHNTATLSRKRHMVDHDKGLTADGRADAKNAIMAQYEAAVTAARNQAMEAISGAFSAMRRAVSAAVTGDRLSADDAAYLDAMQRMPQTQEHFDMLAERFKGSYMANKLLYEVALKHGLQYVSVNADTMNTKLDAAEAFCGRAINTYQGIDHRGASNGPFDLYISSAFFTDEEMQRMPPNELTAAEQDFQRFATQCGVSLPPVPGVPTNPLDEPRRIFTGDYIDSNTGGRFRGFVGV